MFFASEVQIYAGGISCDSGAKERGFSGVLDFVPRKTFLYGMKTRGNSRLQWAKMEIAGSL